MRQACWYEQWIVMKFRRGLKADQLFGMCCFSHPKMASHGPNMSRCLPLVRTIGLVEGGHTGVYSVGQVDSLAVKDRRAKLELEGCAVMRYRPTQSRFAGSCDSKCALSAINGCGEAWRASVAFGWSRQRQWEVLAGRAQSRILGFNQGAGGASATQMKVVDVMTPRPRSRTRPLQERWRHRPPPSRGGAALKRLAGPIVRASLWIHGNTAAMSPASRLT